MKKLFIILAGITAASLFSSCNKMEYKTCPFVVFQKTIYSINEDCGAFSIPVSAYNLTEATTVAFSVDASSTAVSGTDYSFVGNGTVTLSPENPTDSLRFEIVNDKANETGTRTINVGFESATGGVSIPSTTCNVSIADVVVIDWERIERTWVGRDYYYPSGASQGDGYEVVLTKTGENSFTLYNVWGGDETITGTVEFAEDKKSASISIPTGQTLYTSGSYGPLWLVSYNSGYSWADIQGVIDGSGVNIGGPSIGCAYNLYIAQGDYEGYLYMSTPTYTVLTMK